MGLLRLAVLGSPEIFHDDNRLTFPLRKAQALLLYLAVEGGLHPRSKLTALLWPDSATHEARSALRNALTLLRQMLDKPGSVSASHSHLLAEHELLGLNPQAPLELDVEQVQLALKQVQMFASIPSETEHAALVAQLEQAISLIRGPFLDGFWLREETSFDEWHQQQHELWQVRLLTLCERLSALQEAAGELEQVRLTLTRWLSLDPLSEEASRRLMRVYVTQGDTISALQVYTTLQTRLTEALHLNPDAKTEALAESIRATQERGHAATLPAIPVMRQPARELIAPLVGRATAFRDLVEHYHLAQAGQPQAVVLLGETGIGKTRLANEFVAWARAQGADILVGHAFELGGRLPYQPLVEALRTRLEAENAPEDLLEDPWLVELARILPELQVRYPDLLVPTQDEFSAKLRLFEAVARLLIALAQRAPLVLLLEDLHWADRASLDLVRYLGHAWKEHSNQVLLLCTVRSEGVELTTELAAQLSNLDRDLPLTQVLLSPLSRAETVQLLESLAVEGDYSLEQPSQAFASPVSEKPLVALGNFLFTRTDGYPLYLLETLKLLWDRQWLVSRLTPDGVLRLSPTKELLAALAQWKFEHELVPPPVRVLIQTRLAKLSPPARYLVQASAVLGHPTSAYSLWQMADLEMQPGVEALEEAIESGILREESAGPGRPASYRITHELMRDVVYTELGAVRRLVLHQRALTMLESAEGVQAGELAYHAFAAGESFSAYRYSVQAGDEARTIFAVDEAIGLYEQARVLLKTDLPLRSGLSPSQVEHLYVCLERAYAFQNAWTSAQQISEELLAYAQEYQFSVLVCMTLNRLAVLAAQQTREKSEVQALLEQAWQQAQSSHNQRALAETAWNWSQIIGILWANPKRALSHGKLAVALAREIADQELQARSLCSLGVIHLIGGDFEEAIPLLEMAQVLYAALGHEPFASHHLSLSYFTIGPALTQPLTNSASEALCCAGLAMAQLHAGQLQQSMASNRRALALSLEGKNLWAQVYSMSRLAYGLLEVGEYETVFALMQHAVALAQSLPLTEFFPSFLTAQGNVCQALQQWDEARAVLQEAEATTEKGGSELWRVSALSRLCLHYVLTEEWETASHYALRAIAQRKRANVSLILWDFSSYAETEALLHAGEEHLAREEVLRLGERLGSNRRFRLPYLRSLAILAEWQGHSSQAIKYLREADQLAADLGLPAERWQILVGLARVYQTEAAQKQAWQAIMEAAEIIERLAKGIKDETLRARYLAGSQIQPVVQQAQCNATPQPPR